MVGKIRSWSICASTHRHFLMLVATGTLFTVGVALFLWDFFFLGPRQGAQSDAAVQAAPAA